MSVIDSTDASPWSEDPGPDGGIDVVPDAPDPTPTDPPRRSAVPKVADVVVVAASALFVFWQLHPDLLLAETTPAGGDMGAHVWGFAYLRDTLLPQFRTSGWTPDWYAGFPAFQFYMVVPFLGMVALNAGLTGIAALVPAAGSLLLSARAAGAALTDRLMLGLVGAAAVVGAAFGFWHGFNPTFRLVLMVVAVGVAVVAARYGRGWRRRSFAFAAMAVVILGTSLPYGPSFKLVTVAGVVAMPVSAYVFGRLSRLPHPTPALLSVATVAFLFDTNFTIYGGNIASTLAGEFAFSISLALAIAYLGVLVHGLRTGTRRASAAILLALVGLCHLIPAFFALAATAVLLAVHVVAEPGRRGPEAVRTRRVALALAALIGAAGLGAFASGSLTTGPIVTATIAGLVVIALLFGTRVGTRSAVDAADTETSPHAVSPEGTVARARTWWLLSSGGVSALLAAWWVLPFFARRTYLNDMGWEKIAVHREGTAIWDWFRDDVWPMLITEDIRLFAALALIGAVLSIVFRDRIGVALVVLGLGLALAFVYAPQGRLWNARLLPFWYLVVYLLAAIGVGEVVRALAQVLARRPDQPSRAVQWGAAPLVFLLLAAFLGSQLRNVPGGAANADGSYRVVRSVGIPGVVSFQVPEALAVDVRGRNFVTDWSRWNYSGYESKDAYPEYRGIVAEMAEIGRTRGCGRSLWEYNSDLNDYGTPMALMLLPHWTDGCIGSMEGLYFEASSTTPFHFLMQSELSAGPSRAQRDLPYRDLDVDAGVEHLQLMGVKYYLARSAEANTAARANPSLTAVGADGPWIVYEVGDAALVEALVNEPVVTTAGESQHEWLCSGEDDFGRCSGPALDWFQDSTRWDVALAASGPSSWQRVDPGDQVTSTPVAPVVVSDIETTDDRIRFRVDQPGTPVLVKMSYFPNWTVDGADGPYRVAPNLMVVIPTDTEVTLRYGRTGIDLVAHALTLLGLVAALGLARRPPVPVRRLHDESVPV